MRQQFRLSLLLAQYEGSSISSDRQFIDNYAEYILNALLIRSPLIFTIHFDTYDRVISCVCLVLDTNVASDFGGSLTPIPNSISGSVSAGISATGADDDTAADMPASAANLNPGQDLHYTEQSQGTQDTRNPWYSAGIPARLLHLRFTVLTLTR